MKENTDKWIQRLRKRMEEAPVPYEPPARMGAYGAENSSHQKSTKRRKRALWIATSFVAAAAVWLLFMVLSTDAPYADGRLIHIPALQSKAPGIVTVVSKPKQALAGIPFKLAEAQDKTVLQAQDKRVEASPSEDCDLVPEEAVPKEAVPKEARRQKKCFW